MLTNVGIVFNRGGFLKLGTGRNYFRRRGREGFGQSVDVVIKNVVVHRGFVDN